MITGDGLVTHEDEGIFRLLWNVLNKAPIEIFVRNFNEPKDLTRIAIKVPGANDWGRIYFNRIDISQYIALDWSQDPHTHTARWFIENGKNIATATGRTVTIVHQMGSNDPLQAGFKEYGPFRPEGWMSKRIVEKIEDFFMSIIGRILSISH